jgi:para-aminobenzoate synthetase component I
MTTFDPLVVNSSDSVTVRLSGGSEECYPHLAELGRFIWSLGDPGDPVLLLEAFLDSYGLPVSDLAETGRHQGPGIGADHRVCGASVLLSAGVGAAVAGVAGRPTPAPAVPDVVAVVYGRRADRPVHVPRQPVRPASHRCAGESRPKPGNWRVGPWQPSWSPAAHAAAVDAVREAIARGDVYQVNLVGHAAAEYLGDPGPALRRVAALSGARYGGLLRGDGWLLACASPETLVEVAGGTVRTRPIKGTRPATAVGRAELLASAKERAEHIMIVDLERNDLARVARTGSVRVEALYALRRWAGLWQAESQVAADLVPGTGLAALLRAVFPGGSVTGAPKRAALEVIHQLEPVGRGPAMGALGWVGPDRIDLGLTIRTVAATADRLHLWAGGGITWGSDPWAEVAEADAKAAPIRAALAGPGGAA